MHKEVLFDKLCRIADSSVKGELSSLVKECKLFLFDKNVAGLNQDNVYEMAAAAEECELILPFDVCALEVDGAGPLFSKMLLLIEKFRDDGLVRIAPMKCFLFQESDNAKYPDMLFQLNIECTCFYNLEGMLKLLTGDGGAPQRELKTSFKMLDAFSGYFLGDTIKVVEGNVRDPDSGFQKEKLQDVVDAVNVWFRLFLTCIATPKNFILEETPKGHEKLAAKGKKALRVHQRPLYTILRPNEIRKKLGLKDPTKEKSGSGARTVTPHERRRHPRRLTVESGYKENRVIIIEACWVGSSEAVIGNKRYKVRLDV